MFKLSLIIIFLGLNLPQAFSVAHAGDEVGYPYATEACTDSESWETGNFLKADAKSKFKAAVNGKGSFARRMADANIYLKQNKTHEAQFLYRYWIGRIFQSEGIYNASQRAFESIFMAEGSAKTLGIRVAAAECLKRLHALAPGFVMSDEAVTQFVKIPMDRVRKESRSAIYDLALARITRDISFGKEAGAQVQALLNFLSTSAVHVAVANGFIQMRTGQTANAVSSFETFFSSKDRTAYLKVLEDEARILLARGYYKLEKYDLAVAAYKQIDVSSNLKIESIWERAWAHLMNREYGESVGASMNLMTGKLQTTFAPEAPMVSAMAFIEMCQFPSAVRVVTNFKKSYRGVYQWLYSWDQERANKKQDLYATAIGYLKKESEVPDPIGTEWLRSPVFISSQEEINALNRASARAQELIESVDEQARDFSNGSAFAASLKKTLLGYKGQIIARAKVLKNNIHVDLTNRNLAMLKQLSEVAENNQLIDVESYQGATQDILWQNQHPDFKVVSAKLAKDQTLNKPGSTWSWGRTLASDRATDREVWDDELGNMTANLENLCAKRQKYIEMKRTSSASH